MTVAELIAALAKLPQDAEVLVDGHEAGAQPPAFVGLWRFRRDYYGPGHSHSGPHRPRFSEDEEEPFEEFDDVRPNMNAVFISRKQTP